MTKGSVPIRQGIGWRLSFLLIESACQSTNGTEIILWDNIYFPSTSSSSRLVGDLKWGDENITELNQYKGVGRQ